MPSGNITLEKTLPNSVESERAVLGAILLDEKAIFAAAETLTVADFYLEAHREIFRAMLAMAEEENSIDFFTLREELRRRNKEDAAGGPAYVASLTDGLPRAINVGHYAKTVREKATSRQLIQLSLPGKSFSFELFNFIGNDRINFLQFPIRFECFSPRAVVERESCFQQFHSSANSCLWIQVESLQLNVPRSNFLNNLFLKLRLILAVHWFFDAHAQPN